MIKMLLRWGWRVTVDEANSCTSVFPGLAYISEKRQDVIGLLAMCGVVNRMSAGMSGLYLCFAVNTEMSLSRFVAFVGTQCLTHCQIFRWTSRESSSSVIFYFVLFLFCFLLFQSRSPYTGKKLHTADGNVTLFICLDSLRWSYAQYWKTCLPIALEWDYSTSTLNRSLSKYCNLTSRTHDGGKCGRLNYHW